MRCFRVVFSFRKLRLGRAAREVLAPRSRTVLDCYVACPRLFHFCNDRKLFPGSTVSVPACGERYTSALNQPAFEQVRHGTCLSVRGTVSFLFLADSRMRILQRAGLVPHFSSSLCLLFRSPGSTGSLRTPMAHLSLFLSIPRGPLYASQQGS